MYKMECNYKNYLFSKCLVICLICCVLENKKNGLSMMWKIRL